ncbi:MAG: hypothetical protein ACLU99_08550 [Alphaproteobacteria bacterium]
MDFIPGSEKKAMQLTTLSGQTYPLTDFKQERINNAYFLIRSPQNDTAYATGNVNDKINLRVETSRPRRPAPPSRLYPRIQR